jgi:lon-related putative ATP-dependent protease
MRKRYAEFPAVIAYLDAVQEDIVENVQEFRKPQDGPQPVLGMPTPPYATDGSPFFRRYRVNLLVDHSESEGAPVDSEDHPTYVNLIGRIEHIAQMGALITDFNLIKPGALHRANGGYLLLDAREVLLQPYAWEGLKRVLRAGEIGIEPLGQALSLVSTVSLEPEPIPLDVKIILYGERRLYYLLHRLDPDFAELFKVEADFNDEMTRTEDSQLGYARMIGMIARQEELRPFNRGAVARLIEHSTRMVSDTEKLSTHLASLADLMREADYWAQVNENGAITASDIQHAIDAQIERADRLRERLQERINRGVIFIDSQGEVVGQVNGLSIIRLGHFTFGQPNRITARVRLGKGKFIDIEREVALGGPIHSKGVLILSSFLGARYAPEHPLSLSASLVFEQSYGGVEGDSASLAELCALLSALAQAPIKQSLAMTGSVNQRGQIQPIGGVNEKIEGFFDICQARGLTDEQGVIIPRANVQHLMLRQDVVEAVADGAFHIYAAETVDEAMALLTDRPAGQRGSDGQFPTASINHQVERRLIEMAEKQRDFQKKADKEKEEKE